MNFYNSLYHREPDPEEKEKMFDIEINAFELAVILDMLSDRPALYSSMRHFLDQVAQLYMKQWNMEDEYER